ncbi:MAG: hypothetical protein JKX84_10480 [Flavobacteriales bacterium]|nr:hypothetical protein [Flavobacteriales bacterium]
MKEETESGKTQYYSIDYFNGGIGINNTSEAVLIKPDEEYWIAIFGKRKIEQLNDDWIRKNPDHLHFFQNNWVRAKLYFDVSHLCDKLEIDRAHVDNIVIPLSAFEMTDKSMLGDDIRDVARELSKMQEMFVKLESQYKHVRSITFQVGSVNGMHSEKGGYTYSETKNIKFKIPRSLDPFVRALKRLVKSDVELQNHVHNSPYRPYESFSLRKKLKQNQHEMATILFEYLMNSEACKSKRDGYIKTGYLLSLLNNGYVIDDGFFAENRENFDEYASFEDYLADLMGKRIKRYLKNRTENSEN